MGSKKITYLLIVAVGGVWGMILFRIYKATSGDEPKTGQFSGKTAFAPTDVYLPKITFDLRADYRDPFDVRGLVASIPAPVPAGIAKKVPQLPVAPPVAFPAIGYSGYIVNPVSKKLLSIIRMNNQEHMLTEGESKNGVTLIRNMRDSVKVSYQGIVRFLRIN